MKKLGSDITAHVADTIAKAVREEIPRESVWKLGISTMGLLTKDLLKKLGLSAPGKKWRQSAAVELLSPVKRTPHWLVWKSASQANIRFCERCPQERGHWQ